MNNVNESQEAERIDRIYSERSYDIDVEYSDGNPVYLQRIQSIERSTLIALQKTRLIGDIAWLKVLDFGCGNGRWFGRWLAWGAQPENLTGLDVRQSAIDMAVRAFPQCHFTRMTPSCIPHPDAAYDVVVQNIVFSSILDENLRQSAAQEMARVLKPGGLIVWCDLHFNNPLNPNVRAVNDREITLLFPDFIQLSRRRIILAPPIAKRLVPHSYYAAVLVEACFPFLRTHVFALLRKKK